MPVSPVGAFAVSPTRSVSGLVVVLPAVVPERLLLVVVGVRWEPGLELARLMPLYVCELVFEKVGEVICVPRETRGRDKVVFPMFVDVVDPPLNLEGRERGVGVEYISMNRIQVYVSSCLFCLSVCLYCIVAIGRRR